MEIRKPAVAPGLALKFANPSGAHADLGPFSYLSFEGERLIAGPGDEVIAEHVDHRWVLKQGGSFSRMDCSGPVVLRFYSTKHLHSKKFGPYESFSSVDGVAYADRRVTAFCDRQLEDWYSYDTGSHWKVLFVEPAAP